PVITAPGSVARRHCWSPSRRARSTPEVTAQPEPLPPIRVRLVAACAPQTDERQASFCAQLARRCIAHDAPPSADDHLESPSAPERRAKGAAPCSCPPGSADRRGSPTARSFL